MPKLEDFNKRTELDEQFMSMTDEEFRQYAADPDIDQKFLKFDQAKKTAFLNRAIMLDEDSSEYASDVKSKRNYMFADGPEELKSNINKHWSMKDPYKSEKEFHYDTYRTILYKDDETRTLATDIVTNMSATNIVKNSERLRYLLCGHLTLSTEYIDEEKKDFIANQSEERKKLVDELTQGKYRAQEKAEEALPTEDYQIKDPQGKFSINVKVLRDGEKPEDLLNGFDDPDTPVKEKRDKLFSYILHGVKQSDAKKYIVNTRKNHVFTQLLDDYCGTMTSKDVVADKAYLKNMITDDINPNASAFRLNRKVYKTKNKGKEEAPRRIIGSNVFEREAERNNQRQLEENERKAQKEAQEKAVTNMYKAWLEKGRTLGKDSEGRSWAVYADLHKPDELLEYTKEDKEIMLSKIMVGRRVQMMNGMNPVGAVDFNLKIARQFSKDIRETPAFKQIVKEDKVDEYLNKDPIALSEATMGMVHPFNSMTFEQKRQMLEKLKTMAEYVDGSEGRSDKWVRFQRSVASLKNFKPENTLDPDENGENKLEEVFNSAIDYMKGKKTLRRHEDGQARFNQTLDFVTELGKGTEYAGLVAEGIRDRITEVRRKHDPNAEKVWDVEYGADKIGNHSNKPVEPEAENEAEAPVIRI